MDHAVGPLLDPGFNQLDRTGTDIERDEPILPPERKRHAEINFFQEFKHSYCLKTRSLCLISRPKANKIFLLVAILQSFPFSMRSKVRGEIRVIRPRSDLLNIFSSRIFLTLFV